MRNKPILFHDIDGVLFGDYDGEFQLRPGTPLGGVPDQIAYAVCGHTGAGGEVHAMYTHRETFPLKVLKEAVDQLDFGLR